MLGASTTELDTTPTEESILLCASSDRTTLYPRVPKSVVPLARDPSHDACVGEERTELSQHLQIAQTQGKVAKISGGSGCTPKTCGQCKRKASEGAGYEGVMVLHAPS